MYENDLLIQKIFDRSFQSSCSRVNVNRRPRMHIEMFTIVQCQCIAKNLNANQPYNRMYLQRISLFVWYIDQFEILFEAKCFLQQWNWIKSQKRHSEWPFFASVFTVLKIGRIEINHIGCCNHRLLQPQWPYFYRLNEYRSGNDYC